MPNSAAIPELQPIVPEKFTLFPVCKKCRNMPKPPFMPVWFVRWCNMRAYGCAISYCPGNRDATSTIPTFVGQIEHVNSCAGLATDHLHVHCGLCHYTWLMEPAI